MGLPPLAARMEWGLIPAVPVPFRGSVVADDAQRRYAAWMAQQPVAGVAVWAHTGRGPHLSAAQRATVLTTWRAALPDKLIVAGADSVAMAREAKQGGADAVLAFPTADDPIGYHAALAAELPVIAFYLYEAAGGVAYDNPTLHGILSLPNVLGIKVATLDSVMTFQRIAGLTLTYADRLLLTGEDRFLGYSLTMGARAALIGMGAALTAYQAALVKAFSVENFGRFMRLSGAFDKLGAVAFGAPVEGYIRRMLWALAEEGVIPSDACDDPWGPPLDPAEHQALREALRAAKSVRLSGGF